MVVHDLNVVGISRSPSETDSPLSVDANAVLASSIPLQPFELVTWRYPKVIENRGCIEYPEFAERYSLHLRAQLLDGQSPEEVFSVSIPEALDHE